MVMAARWILLFLLSLTATHVFSQFNRESRSNVSLKGIGFIEGPNNFMRAAKDCGIYSTERDLQSGVLSLSIDCKAEDHRIKAGFIRDKSAIKIVRYGETSRYLKQDIHGYRDCRGNEYHFFEGKSYQLVNPGESIRIYVVYQPKGKQRVAKYFFSSVSSTMPKALTLENLRVEFSGEHLFLEKLRLVARNDFELVKHRYIINRVRQNTLQNI